MTAQDADRQYACDVVPVARLDAQTRLAMATLYASVYDASSRDLFLTDLAHKDEALLLRANGDVVGFTTLVTYSREWRGAPLRVLYSGDTVVHPAHWGQQALSFAWVRHLAALRRRAGRDRLVWFLLVKGHRTYRYLHVFARSFFPGRETAGGDLAALADALASERFPRDYNPKSGLVEFRPSRGHLKPEYALPRPDEMERDGVGGFLERNPRYRDGYELACVCDIAESNMKPLTLRLFRQGLHAAA